MSADTSERTAQLIRQAREFFQLPEVAQAVPAERWNEVLAEIATTGTYRHTAQELNLGCRLAWRNHARCLGRWSWRSLVVIDARDRTSADEVAEACWEHLRRSTNGGALRAVITVLPQQAPDGGAIRIRNPQLIRYAGYRQPDGSVVGDPLHVELTEQCQRMGWIGKQGQNDVLPLVVELPDGSTHLYEVPEDAVLEVELHHPDLPWFAELGMRWHANPAISNLDLEIGGIVYTAAPFSGWYVSSEIGARNLSDADRYNLLPVVAARMGLDTSNDRTLWRDRALIELNHAVLHSYRAARVHIIDHHTAARQFVSHIEREEAAGRQVPADWRWVNAPLSASTTPTFHREFDPPDFSLRPNFVPRPDPTGQPVAAQCPHALAASTSGGLAG